MVESFEHTQNNLCRQFRRQRGVVAQSVGKKRAAEIFGNEELIVHAIDCGLAAVDKRDYVLVFQVGRTREVDFHDSAFIGEQVLRYGIYVKHLKKIRCRVVGHSGAISCGIVVCLDKCANNIFIVKDCTFRENVHDRKLMITNIWQI